MKQQSIVMIRRLLLLVLSLSLSSLSAAQTIGPENGSLVIVGGGMRDLSILHRFAELAGGPDAPIVVIPTAGGGENYDDFWAV
jgi:hypothetical protein